MSEENAVSCRNVAFAYRNATVLEDVTFDVGRGDFASVVGPNGGGKTTLLKLLLGLLAPDRGTVRLLGGTPTETRHRAGYTPQHLRFDDAFPISVRDVVLMGRLGQSGLWYNRRDREAAMAALKEVRLAEMASRPFAALSGGERQRVLIARAIVGEPEILLLDEPTSNVDPSAEESVLSILEALNERMTILLVSHDLGFVSKAVRTVICVNRQVVIHPTSELTGELVREIYGPDVRMVRHDHRCGDQGHDHVY